MTAPGAVPGLSGGGSVEGTLVDVMGIVVDEVTPDIARAHIVMDLRHLQPYGIVHGGVYAMLAETLASLGGTVRAMRDNPDGTVVGLENHTSFLRACGPGTTVTAEAVPRHAGRRVQSWHVSMRDGEGRELATSNVRLLVVTRDRG